MAFKTAVLALAGLLCFANIGFAQDDEIERAQDQYFAAQQLERALNEKPVRDRTRAEYLRLINSYQRVYLITHRTSYADNALMSVARLYETIDEIPSAIKTLTFLIREYPTTPFKRDAGLYLARLEKGESKETPVVEVRGGNAAPLRTTAVENLRYWEAQNSVRVVVDVGSEVRFQQGEAKNPDRVFIDISPAKLNTALIGKQWPVKSGLLQQIRVGQYDNTTVRIVLDVGAIGRVSSFPLKEPDRLVIDVLGEGQQTVSAALEAVAPRASSVVAPPARPAAPTTTKPAITTTPNQNSSAPAAPKPQLSTSPQPSTPPQSAPVAVAAAAPVAPTTATPQPALATTQPLSSTAIPAAPTPAPVAVTPAQPTNSGSRSLIRSLGLKISKVVIDAGHGGHDTGSVGPTGYMEKELVLDVANRLKTLIEKELGAEVVMTRTEDVFVPLETRTEMANRQEADLFISIHANSSRVKSVRGVETFFLNLPSSRDALEIASRENAASQKTIHELQDVVQQIMLSDKVDESRELALHIQNAMAARKDAGQNRGVKQAPFVVLVGAKMPSILAEVGFISNPQEERSIKTGPYRQRIAESLFEGVRSYADTLSGVKSAKSQEKN